MWRQSKLDEKPEHTWQEAVVKWLRICKRKSMRSLKEAGFQLMWVDPYLKNKKLSEIDTDLIDKIIDARRKGNLSNATINRLLEVIRAVLNNAFKKGWVTKTPCITLFDEVERDRWLTKDEAERLLKELPSHLSDMAIFTLLTGLRKSNVTGLRWKNVDLVKRHAFVPASQSKTNKAIPVPLSTEAIAIIRKQIGKHIEFVFSYQGKVIKQCATAAWYKALKRAEIEDFHWHDLRHTWASWHVQNGTSLYELQRLGGWSSYGTV